MKTNVKREPLVKLTPEAEQQFKWALNCTWQAIGGDILECNGGKDLRRSEVIDCVLDADYMLMYGQLNAEMQAEWKSLPYRQREAIAKRAFSYAYYGR